MNTLPEKTIVLESLKRCSAIKRKCKGCAYAGNCKKLYVEAAELLASTEDSGDTQERVIMLATLISELENKLSALEVGNLTAKSVAAQYKASCVELEAANKELFKAFNKMKALYHIKCAELDELTKSSKIDETDKKNAE